MKDFSVQLTNRPGDFARVAQTLGRHGINIKSVAALVIGNQAMARVLTDEVEAARRALESANIRFSESEVATVLLENKAGQLAAVTSRLAEADVNLEALYLTGVMDDLVEIAIVSDDPKKTKKLLEEF
ncbi:MAG: hypothetical protein HY704_13505 [Gemmatimonadetes bacterium]|nr:hypothetical protein [Gemmatimonadota bacterium]